MKKLFLFLFLAISTSAFANYADAAGVYEAETKLTTLATGSVTMLSTIASFSRGDFVSIQFRGNGYWAWGTVASAVLPLYNAEANLDTISFRWGGIDVSLIGTTTATCPIVVNRQRDL